MVMSVVFRKLSELSPTYDWFDFTSGVGYRTYYACADNASSAAYFLTTSVIPSSATNARRYLEAQNNTQDRDFDLQFNFPVTLKGDMLVYYSQSIANGGSGAVTITAYHYDGSTETSIGTTTAATRTSAGAEYYRDSLKIALTERSFAIGEKLRITLSITETANQAYDVYHDPESRATFTETTTGATIGSNMAVCVPFKVDVGS